MNFQQVHPPGRAPQPVAMGSTQLHTSRPLSSADEAGPVAKKLRSAAPQPEMARSSKPLKLTVDEPLKKARVRPALKFSNPFSSSGRPSQPPIPSRAASGTGKSNNHALVSSTGTRRSTRLNSGTTTKQPYGSKVRKDLPCFPKVLTLHNSTLQTETDGGNPHSTYALARWSQIWMKTSRPLIRPLRPRLPTLHDQRHPLHPAIGLQRTSKPHKRRTR